MTPKSIKRPRESIQSTVITPSGSHKKLLFSDTNSDSGSDFEVIRFDPNCILEDPNLEEEEKNHGQWESLESCIDDEEFFDATQTMDTNSFGDLTSSDLSMDPDFISSDDDDRIEEFLIYKEARRQQKQTLQCSTQQEEEEFEEIDEINMRFLMSNVSPKKPCTMTSASGEAACMNMRQVVMPAREMLTNYFHKLELNTMLLSKENVVLGKPVTSITKNNPVRNVLSEKN